MNARTSYPGPALLAGLCLAAAGCDGAPQPSPLTTGIDGLYTLRIESTCAALPEDIRTRTYAASVAGGTVTLSNATFWMHPTRGLLNTMDIDAIDDRVALRLDSISAPFIIKGIVEETSPETYFSIVGTGTGIISRPASGPVTIQGTLSSGVGWGANLLDDAQHVGCPAGHTATFRFTSGATTSAPPGVANTLIDLEVEGTSTVAPGQQVQMIAAGRLADGSTRDVTSRARWSRWPTTAIDLASDGAVTGRALGESTVTATLSIPNYLGVLRDGHEVIVVSAGTVRVAGRITAGQAAQPVADASVRVVTGAAAGLATTTDWEGRYALYGVAGDSVLRVSKAGYVDEERRVDGSTHQTLDISMAGIAAVPDVSGRYTLTITADPACASPLPEPLNIRTYTAVISQVGRVLDVSLSGVPFFVVEGRGGGFPGLADPAELTFRLDDNDHFDIGSNLDVVEVLGGAKVLFVLGHITTTIAANRLTGTLNGRLQLADRALPSNGFVWGASCDSSRHQVEFSR
jgi:hypothetical protein